MGNMKDIGLLDCEDRPSIEENFKRVQGSGGGGGGAPDWNASEGEEGHIKNRTHYERTIVHDFVTEIIVPSGTSLADGYGTLPNLKIPIRNVVMPEGKYILIRLGGEELKLTALPPNVGGSRPAYREDITLNNGVTIRIMLTTDVPGTHLGDRNNYYYNVMPVPDGAEVPYIGQTYSVSLCEDELKQLDPKFLPEGIGGGGGDNLFLTTITMEINFSDGSSSTSCDKTYEQILDAYNGGKVIVLRYVLSAGNQQMTRFYTAMVALSNNQEFMFRYNTPEGGLYSIYLYPDNTIEEYNATLISQVEINDASGLIMRSHTPGSEKRFRIEVDDNGTITATQV